MTDYLTLWLLLIPFAGAIVGIFVPRRLAKHSALLFSLATLGVAIAMAANFDFAGTSFRPEGGTQLGYGLRSDSVGIFQIGFSFSLGVDSISMWLVLLTAFLMPLALLSSFQSIQERQKEYYAWMLLLHVAMLGAFVARDLLLFYVFFELTLIPMFFIIGIWGGPERRMAAGRFFLFTFTGSVFTLAAAIYLGTRAGTFALYDYPKGVITFAQQSLTNPERFWVLMGLVIGFAVKVPLFPVHTWLPLAHTEAPTAGSVILAGVLLKLGTYGLLRFAVPIGLVSSAAGGAVFPAVAQFLAVLCIIGIIYGALVAWVQRDIKKLVAYSSVSHLGFCVLGLVAMNTIGIEGSVLYMINHGLSTGALFLVIGMIYDRYHTRDINELSGLARRMPLLAFFFVLFAMSSIGLPGLNGFSSEFLTVLGAFTSKHLGPVYGGFAALGVILGAVYMLHMLARVLFGPLKLPRGFNVGPAPALAGHGATHGATHGTADAGTGHGHTAHGTAHGQEDAGQGAGQSGGDANAGGHSPGGPDSHAAHPAPGDINAREITILLPLAIVIVLLGVLPSPVINSLRTPSQKVYTAAPMLRDANPVEKRATVHAPPALPAVEAVSLKTQGLSFLRGMGASPMILNSNHGRGAHATED